MSTAADIQYGADVASLYDAVIGDPISTDEALQRCRTHLSGRRVLDIGVGTGRIAIPLADIAQNVVGIDNAPAMLEQLHAKALPASLSTGLADLREPLPFAPGTFDGAVSTLGSFACVRSTAELARGFQHLADVLRPGSPFLLDYYSQATYEALAAAGPVIVPNALHPSTSSVVATISGQSLDVRTTVTPFDGSEAVTFEESVLLLSPQELATEAGRAGFSLREQVLAAPGAPFDYFVLVKE